MKFMAQLNATGYYNKRCVCRGHVSAAIKKAREKIVHSVRHEYSRQT